MSSASRPTWSAASGSSKAPTAQYSSKDTPSHVKLKERKKLPMTINESSSDDDASLYNDDEAQISSSSDDEDEEELLLRELVKMKGERRKEIIESNPLLSSKSSLPWYEESVFRVNLRESNIVKKYTNDTTQTKYHKEFMSRMFI